MIFKIAKWLSHALVLQMFLLSLSFPVLVSWGIAFSPLVFLGNILFTPILTLFLGLSCVVYVLELGGISSGSICAVLDLVAYAWVNVMSWAPDIPMVGCPQAPFWVLIIMPLGSWVILRIYGIKNSFKTLIFLLLWVFVVFFSIKWYFSPVYKELNIVCGSRTATLVCKDKKITFIDTDNALQTRACSASWIEYTLSSQLVKNFGATRLDAIIVQKSTPATVRHLQALCKKYHCKKVFDMQGLRLQI